MDSLALGTRTGDIFGGISDLHSLYISDNTYSVLFTNASVWYVIITYLQNLKGK